MQVDTFFPSFFPPVSYYFFLLNGVSRIKENAWCKGPATTKWLLSNPYILPSVAQGMEYLIREKLQHPRGNFNTVCVLLLLFSQDTN